MEFGSTEDKTSCIIVNGKEEESYANLLFGLIGEFQEYECALWTEKQYNDTRAEIPSSEKVIFIGNTKNTKKIIPNIQLKYDKFGMKYGWLGNQAVIYVDGLPKKKEEYNAFCDYSALVYDQFKKYETFFNIDTAAKKALFAVPLLLGPIYRITTLSILVFFSKKKRRQITNQQYNVVVRDFFTIGLDNFMEG